MKLRNILLLAVLLASPALAQSVKVVDPSTGLPVFSAANPAPVAVISGGGSTPTGPAGTPNASVVTVQGITGGTVLPVGGNVASGAADSGNPVKIGGLYNTALPTFTNGQRGDVQISAQGALQVRVTDGLNQTFSFAGINADAANPAGTYVFSEGMFFNGTTWDRARSIITGTNSTGTGIAAAGLVGQGDDAAIQSITENSFGNARIALDTHALIFQREAVVPYSVILHTAAVQVRGASGNVANAAATATLTGTATTTVYISGFSCTPGGATAAALVSPTITGTLGGTFTYTAGAPATATAMGSMLTRVFDPPHPASAVNTPIVVSMPALGTGNTNATCEATGFYM